MTALRTLIEAVEDGNEWDAISGTKVMNAVGLDNVIQFRDALNGSVDAALVLMEAVLPDIAIERMSVWPGHPARISLWGTHEERGGRWHNQKDGRWEAEANTPARALLLAILKAMEATNAGKE